MEEIRLIEKHGFQKEENTINTMLEKIYYEVYYNNIQKISDDGEMFNELGIKKVNDYRKASDLIKKAFELINSI